MPLNYPHDIVTRKLSDTERLLERRLAPSPRFVESLSGPNAIPTASSVNSNVHINGPVWLDKTVES